MSTVLNTSLLSLHSVKCHFNSFVNTYCQLELRMIFATKAHLSLKIEQRKNPRHIPIYYCWTLLFTAFFVLITGWGGIIISSVNNHCFRVFYPVISVPEVIWLLFIYYMANTICPLLYSYLSYWFLQELFTSIILKVLLCTVMYPLT